MAQPVAFEQDPSLAPGGGTFHFDDGRSILAYEPDLAKSLPDLRLAQNDAQPGAGGAPGSQGPSTATSGQAPYQATGTDATQAAPVPPPAPQGPAGAPAEPGASTGLRTVANALGTATGVVGGPLVGLAGGYLAGKAADAFGAPPAPQAGGVTSLPEALPAQGAQAAPEATPLDAQRRILPRTPGGYVPTTQERTRETQGAPYTEEDARLRIDAERSVQRAQAAEYDRQASVAHRDAALAQAQAPYLALQAAEGQRKVADAQNNYNIERAKYETEADDFDKRAHVDPQHFFNSRSTLANIGLVIGQAMGAFGAAITHSDNYAQKIVDQAIHNDIAAQEMNIREGRASMSNALFRLQQHFGGDLEQAKTALALIQQRAVNNGIEAQLKGDASQQAQNAGQIWLAQSNQKILTGEQALYSQSMGKTVTKENTKYQAPSGGGLESEEVALKRQATSAKYRKEIAESNATVAAGGKDPNKAAGGVSARLQPIIVAAKNAGSVINETAGALGMKRDAGGQLQDPSLSTALWSQVWLTEPHQKVNSARESLIAEIGKSQSGGALHESTAKALEDQVRTARTPGELGAVLRHYDRLMKDIQQNVRETAATAGNGPEPGQDTGEGFGAR